MDLRSIFFLFFIFICTSCAKTKSEKTDEAIDIALTYLSDSQCSKAIKVLEAAGRTTANPIYLQVLASAYACRAGYSEIDFLATEIDKLDSTTAGFMKSLTTFIWADDSEADSDAYVDFQEAIDLLLYVDDQQPSQVRREAKFGTRKSGDMAVQALFLSIAQLGKFLDFYGNVDALGTKGGGATNTDEQGATASTCFITYTDVSAVAYLASSAGGACISPGSFVGHPNLSLAGASLATTKIRMCQGLMLVTNMIDILDHTTFPTGAPFDDLASVATTIDAFKTAVTGVNPALLTLLDTTSQTECESLVSDSTEFNNLQLIYALLFETNLP
jgi:hypothetical protein